MALTLPQLPQQLPKTQADWQRFLNTLQQWANAITAIPQGPTVVIVTAKLTSGGTTGSMTFTSGILTSQIPAT